ncbi:hypothetical protein UFOVP614_52 [uncultured Caudovirales phage]|uniref:Uncharacterized protein n=1 Tax=uncultured Caudovirales phage TaxID=2100421 RepID=A0A6J5N0P9_9CAUD|nr:hypothetical protein UFOVP614_52 [uncultured Caudovirales phage]
MISTEIYIEEQKIDLLQDISTEFTYAIDDVSEFGSRNTSYSKTISIPGTANNNLVFGYIFEMNNANLTYPELPNVGYNFNVTKQANCKIFIDKVQIFKGTLRILEIVIDKETIEYQCSVVGELGGFINQLGNQRLEDLNFSAYNHTYSVANISASWDNAGGSGYYYPLIDYGNVSTGTYGTLKKDFQYTTFRPALYVKQYIEKIFSGTDYTFNCPFFDTALFKRLIIPHNQTNITTLNNTSLKAAAKAITINTNLSSFVEYTMVTAGNFTLDGLGQLFTYGAGATITTDINVVLNGSVTYYNPPLPSYSVILKKNNVEIGRQDFDASISSSMNCSFTVSGVTFATTDTMQVEILGNGIILAITSGNIGVLTSTPTQVQVNLGENININDTIPKGIFQKDFFLSIVKMFNLYVYENKFNDKELVISPYVDFYPEKAANAEDWTNKIDRSKPLSIKPMSEVNARYYNYKFATDNDFYSENYRKKYTEGYGDFIYDTKFDFVKETDTLEVIFAGSVLFQQTGQDKVFPAIYKKSNTNNAEDRMDSIIRIMQTKKITGVSSWNIMNGATNLASYTSYGYAGHLDDPINPQNDINFGAPKEIQFSPNTYPITNVFAAFHSPYIAEITSEYSKLLTCYGLLDIIDIFNLDFSKYIWIDGVLFRLNKVENFNPMEYNTTKLSFLKVIDTSYN